MLICSTPQSNTGNLDNTSDGINQFFNKNLNFGTKPVFCPQLVLSKKKIPEYMVYRTPSI